MGDADGFVHGPTPLEAADHIEKWEAMKATAHRSHAKAAEGDRR